MTEGRRSYGNRKHRDRDLVQPATSSRLPSTFRCRITIAEVAFTLNALESLANHISAFSSEALGSRFKESATIHLLDTVGSLTAGCFTHDGSTLLRLYKLPAGRATVLTPLTLDDILVRSAITRLTEVDDVHMKSLTTPGSVIFPTVLTLAPRLGANVNDVLNAIGIGYEAIIRLGLAISGPFILEKGIWPTYYCAAFGSAAATSKLLNLDTGQVANALSLALVTSTGLMAEASTPLPSRWFALGRATRAGCEAAFGAHLGLTSETDIVEKGWLTRACGEEEKTALIVGSGNFHDYLSEVSLKPYCSAKQAICAIEAFGKMLAAGLEPRNIETVSVFVPKSYARMISRPVVRENRLSMITNVSMQIGLRAYGRQLLYDVERSRVPDSAAMNDLISKVEVFPDDSLESVYPEKCPARVELHLKDGSRRSETITESPGDPESPLTEEERLLKFHSIIGPHIPESQRQELARYCIDAFSDTESFMALSRFMDKLTLE